MVIGRPGLWPSVFTTILEVGGSRDMDMPVVVRRVKCGQFLTALPQVFVIALVHTVIRLRILFTLVVSVGLA